jgi:hypothetical protein
MNGHKPAVDASAAAMRVLYWAFMLALASTVFLHFLRTSGVNSLRPASIDRLLTRTADKPYIYRVLLPTAANSLAPLLDGETALSIGKQAETVLGRGFFRADLDGKRHPSQVLLILAMMYLSLVGFAVTIWILLGNLGYSPIIQYAVPPLLVVGSTLFMQFGYIYDFSTLFLFSLGCLLMQRQQWVAYLVVFACATLNKETAIFLSVIFGLVFVSRLPRRHFFLLLAIQLATFGLLQGAIRYVFRDNPGAAMPSGFFGQLTALHTLAFHRPLVLLYFVLWLLIMAAQIGFGWGDKPLILRAGLGVLPFFLVLYLVSGFAAEIRVMLEVYPIIAVLTLPPPWAVAAPGGSADPGALPPSSAQP